MQLQEGACRKFLEGTYTRTSWSKGVYGPSLKAKDPISGRHYETNPLPKIDPDAVLDKMGSEKIVVLTICKNHSKCHHQQPVPSPEVNEVHLRREQEDVESATAFPSSAGGLFQRGTCAPRASYLVHSLTYIHAHARPLIQLSGAFGRHIPAEQLARAVKQRYNAQGCNWKTKRVLEEIKLIDPGATYQTAHRVMANLSAPVLLTKEFASILLQGLVSHLRKNGWGVALHKADAFTVVQQVILYTLPRASFTQTLPQPSCTCVSNWRTCTCSSTLPQPSYIVPVLLCRS